MRKRDECVAGVEITLHGAKVGFHGPEGGDDAGGYAVFGFCTVEDRLELRDLLLAGVEAGLGHRALENSVKVWRKTPSGRGHGTEPSGRWRRRTVSIDGFCGKAFLQGFGLHTSRNALKSPPQAACWAEAEPAASAPRRWRGRWNEKVRRTSKNPLSGAGCFELPRLLCLPKGFQEDCDRSKKIRLFSRKMPST